MMETLREGPAGGLRSSGGRSTAVSDSGGPLQESCFAASECGIEEHCDYMSWALRLPPQAVTLQAVLSTIGDALLGEPDPSIFRDTGYGSRRYDHLYTGPLGLRIEVGKRGDDAGECVDVLLTAKGEAFESMNLTAWENLLYGCLKLGIMPNVKRFDYAFDHCGFTLDDVVAAMDKRGVRSWAKHLELMGSCKQEKKNGEYEDVGECGRTFYAGVRGSDRMVRIYDKRGFTRCEGQWSGVRAGMVLAAIAYESSQNDCDWDEAAKRLMKGELVDYLNFVDRESAGNITRCKRLAWWDAFVEGAARIRRIVPRAARTLERSISWIKRQVAPSLAVFVDVVRTTGGDVRAALQSVVDDGRRRRSVDQASCLDALRLGVVHVALE